MTAASSRPVPPDQTCTICAKPIQSEGFILTRMGGAVHIRCRSEELGLRATEEKDRARLIVALVTDMAEQTRHRHAAGLPSDATAVPFAGVQRR